MAAQIMIQLVKLPLKNFKQEAGVFFAFIFEILGFLRFRVCMLIIMNHLLYYSHEKFSFFKLCYGILSHLDNFLQNHVFDTDYDTLYLPCLHSIIWLKRIIMVPLSMALV